MKKNMGAIIRMLIVIVAVAGAVSASQVVNESHPVPSGAEIEVDNLAGALVIEGWGSDKVEVTGTLGTGVEGIDIDVDQENGYVSIDVDYDEHYHGRQTVNTELLIRLPAGSPLSIDTVSSSISVDGMTSLVEIETVSGKVEIGGRPSKLDIESVSGLVKVETAPSGTTIEAVSGRIEIESAMGDFDAENVSGEILVNSGTLGDVDLETVSGSIKCYAMAGPAGDIDMETMSGSITLTVDPKAAASYELSTFSGAIKNDIGPEPRKTSKYTPGKELIFNTGQNGPNISLTSFSGTISLMVR